MFNLLIKNAGKQSGQALLVVVLIMVVSLTIGLSVASKSIINYKSSTEQAESQKALSAAEAGIEQAIKTQNSTNGSIDMNLSSFKTTVVDSSGQSLLLNGGNVVSRDQGIDVWLSNYPNYNQPNPPVGNLSIYWGTSTDPCDDPALEVALIYGTTANPSLTKAAFDPCSNRRNANNFKYVSGGGATIGGKTFKYGTSIQISNRDGLIARIIPIYANGEMGVSADHSLPSQGKTITSVGSSGTSQRAVTVFKGHPEVSLEFFPYNLFSP